MQPKMFLIDVLWIKKPRQVQEATKDALNRAWGDKKPKQVQDATKEDALNTFWGDKKPNKQVQKATKDALSRLFGDEKKLRKFKTELTKMLFC